MLELENVEESGGPTILQMRKLELREMVWCAKVKYLFIENKH